MLVAAREASVHTWRVNELGPSADSQTGVLARLSLDPMCSSQDRGVGRAGSAPGILSPGLSQL